MLSIVGEGLFGNSFEVSIGVEPMLVLHLHSLGLLAQSCPFSTTLNSTVYRSVHRHAHVQNRVHRASEMFLAFP